MDCCLNTEIVLQHLAAVTKNEPSVEIHVAAHSARAIFHAPLVQMAASSGEFRSGPMKGKTGLDLKVASCTLWAPACTVELFEQTYLSLVKKGSIERFALLTLNDSAEQNDDCANIYHKLLLYLVSNAFEDRPHIPSIRDGDPILGIEKIGRADERCLQPFSIALCQSNSGRG